MKKEEGNIVNSYTAWKLLEEHYEKIKKIHLRQLFVEDPQRGEKMVLEDAGIYFDYSKHRITTKTLNLLLQLAEQAGLPDYIEAMFRGERINVTENRAVLHIALRAPREHSLVVDGKDVVVKVHEVLDRMIHFSNQIRSGQWRGFTGKPIRNVLNIGIGGSHLGPEMAYEALRYYSLRDIHFAFISNVDGTDFAEAVNSLDPEETLFIISSKSFATTETMANAYTARTWLLNHLKDSKAISKHFVAVSTNIRQVQEFGIAPENMFVFWDWVGGRYSLCSAIGLSTMIAIGPENFYSLLEGFHQMDEHFHHTPLERNIPVLMALLGIWYNNFFGAQTTTVLPYEQYLKLFPAYLQQLTMESNGKNIDIEGRKVSYQTGPIYWGEVGTKGQHSFYQLIHQGTKLIPCDFITFLTPLHKIGNHHELLISNVYAQAEALAFGKVEEKLREEGVSKELIPYRTFEGNRPSSIIMLNKLTPANLGKLIALYEHTVFTQGVIWKINSFDQWGVELGKILAAKIARELKDPTIPELYHDSSTNQLIRKYWKRKE
ncbi:MAG: glucose-6-phosphate isomerase [Atribacterota bacterium]|nr:glucose-6-phosphate isomerase [Atribacterota bacterium]MDD5637144.1 glucose-6-phosphate isomerase [Atribacterota bacterium]